tara:strand:- start:356 stop:880 length:525 start_codon:yes stop_codon:yes gene_type:complete
MSQWIQQKNRRNRNRSNFKYNTKPKDLDLKLDSNEIFPELSKQSNTYQTKLQKKMNYIGVASKEVIIEREEPVKDGWIKLTRNKDGFVSKKYGKEVKNSTIEYLEENDNHNIINNMLIRHNNYRVMDNSIYFNDYKYSWETMSDESEISDGFNTNEEDNNENDENNDFDDEYDY